MPPPSSVRSKKRKSRPGDGSNADDAAGSAAPRVEAAPITYGIFAAFGEIEDEYDPALPNDYEQAKAAQEEAVLDAEREARRAVEERAMEGRLDSGTAGLGAGANGSSPTGASAPGGAAGGGGGGGGGGMSAAMRMMKSMGWSEGRGLGREGQGMATPIVVEKTDARAGRIVSAAAMPGSVSQPHPQAAALPPPAGPPTRVVLLRNMVGPGAADEGLEDEVAEEVAKHGAVERVLVFELAAGVAPPEEAVRIFVEMETTEGAAAAVSALHGRWFDQRQIRAAFFDEARLAAMDLAPRPGEA